MMMQTSRIFISIFVVLGFLGCTSDKVVEGNKKTTTPVDERAVTTPPPRSKVKPMEEPAHLEIMQNDGSEGLKAHFQKLQDAISKKDTKLAARITRNLFPDETALKVALRSEAPEDKIKKILAMYARFSKGPDSKIAYLIKAKPDQTEIKVFAATTEEIAANKKGSLVWMQFPGGAVKAAGNILKKNMTFYEVKCVKPGKKSGMKYHLFFYDGKKWKMLGPVWRALR
jgi:hypothetical protein